MLPYSEYKDKIKSGDLLAWSSKSGLYDNIIRIFTESDYVHVAVAYVEEGKHYVIEAEPPNVRRYPLEEKGSFFHIPMGMNFTPAMQSYLFSKIGRPYSYWNAVVSYFTKPPEDRAWQCAQLTLEYYKAFGVNVGDTYTPDGVVKGALALRNTEAVFVEI